MGGLEQENAGGDVEGLHIPHEQCAHVRMRRQNGAATLDMGAVGASLDGNVDRVGHEAIPLEMHIRPVAQATASFFS